MRRTMITLFAIAAMPAATLAQDTTSRGGQDTTARGGQQQPQTSPRTPADTNRMMQAQTPGATSDVKPDRMPTNQARSSQGRRTSGARGMMLSRENIVQLQTALNEAGCDAGAADGIIGPRTRRAITCARQKNNVTSNEELYRSLNLDFGTSGTTGTPTTPSGGVSADSSRMQPPPTTGDSTAPRGNSPTSPADTTTRRDSTQRQQ